MAVPKNSWMVYFMENPKQKWMMNRGYPYLWKPLGLSKNWVSPNLNG